MSRLGCGNIDKNDSLAAKAKSHVRFIALSSVPKAITAKEIEEASAKDVEMQTLHNSIETGCFDNVGLPNSYKLIRNEFCTVGNLVLRGNRIVMPVALRPHVISLAHIGHIGTARMKKTLTFKGMVAKVRQRC